MTSAHQASIITLERVQEVRSRRREAEDRILRTIHALTRAATRPVPVAHRIGFPVAAAVRRWMSPGKPPRPHGRGYKFAEAALLIVLLSPLTARAWDSGGHEVVATMAYARLNPKAQQALTDLAHQLVNPEQTYDAITIACWMDDLRRNTNMPYHNMFLSWHYIDLGLEPDDPAPSLQPGDDNDVHGNVVQALKRALVVLQGGTDPYVTSKAVACAMVMHLVGDIHQPLHCSTKYFFSYGQMRNDAGGNKEFVINGPPGDTKFNLHAFWDSAWRASFDGASGDVVLDDRFHMEEKHAPETVRAVAEEMAKQPPPSDADLNTNIDAWARESNAVARNFVYRELTATDNKKYCRLGSEYVAHANELARQRLVLAAWRLAVLLNDTLGADHPGPPPAAYPAGPASQPW